MARRSRGGRGSDSYGWMGLISLIAILLLGLALVLQYLFTKVWTGAGEAGNWVFRVAFIIALIVPTVLSFYRALSGWRGGSRSGIVWFVLWVIAVILIIVFLVLNWI